MPRSLPPRPSLDWLRKTARQQLRELRKHRPRATLAAVHFTLAREYGFPSWRALKAHLERLQSDAGAAQSSCSFCGKSQYEVHSLIEGGCGNREGSTCVFICDECVAFSAQIIADREGCHGPSGQAPGPARDLVP